MTDKDILTMSAPELDRAMIIDRVIEQRLSRVDAAEQLGISPRHMGRLIKAYREHGAVALISKKRGKRSNRAYPPAYKALVLEIVREHYHDFGPTLVAEKLAERHNVHLSDESLRSWMVGWAVENTQQESPAGLSATLPA